MSEDREEGIDAEGLDEATSDQLEAAAMGGSDPGLMATGLVATTDVPWEPEAATRPTHAEEDDGDAPPETTGSGEVDVEAAVAMGLSASDSGIEADATIAASDSMEISVTTGEAASAEEGSRVCPLCEKVMEDGICPEDGVPTIERSMFEEEDEVLKNGMLVAGRYRIEGILGKGAMGSVFLATQTSMDRKVALKTMQATFQGDQSLVRRFYLEARAASKLEHPNIVRIFDFGVDDETKIPFIAMEFLEGDDLGDTLKNEGAMPERKACRILVQAVKALVEAHEKGIVHRDLKPDNVHLRFLADGEAQAKVLDFGIAKVLHGDEDTSNLTGTGMTMGTAHYMPPEQIRGDLYAVGCILHEMLTNERPYSGDDRLGILMQHLTSPVPALPAALADGSPPSDNVRALHAALLSKGPEMRPTETKLVAVILAAIGMGDDINARQMLLDDNPQSGCEEARTESAPADATMAQPALAFDGKPADETMKPSGEETAVLQARGAEQPSSMKGLLIAAVVLLLAGGGGFVWWQGEQAKKAEAQAAAVAAETQKKEEAEAEAKKKAEAEAEAKKKAAAVAAPAPTAPALPKYKIAVETTPVGASVNEGEQLLGMTPMSISLRKGQESRTITVLMDGYEPMTLRATRDMPETLKLSLKSKAKPKTVRSGSKSKTKAKKPKPATTAPAAAQVPVAAHQPQLPEPE